MAELNRSQFPCPACRVPPGGYHTDTCSTEPTALIVVTSSPCVSCQQPMGADHAPDCKLPLVVVMRENQARAQQAREQVDHPKHYGGADDPYEAIKVMEAWHGPEAVYWFCLLSAEKYQSRMGKKPGEPIERDVAKAA